MFRTLLFVLVLTLPALPQEPPRVEVPTFPNASCPIMGKPASLPLFVDTALGRIYVCCKPCIRKIRADVPVAHKTAYPAVEELANKTCPVSGEPIGEGAVAVTLQGFRFKVCCEGCVEAARASSQLVLTKLNRAKLVDVGNRTCPLSGKPVAANAFALVDDQVVHLGSPQLVAELEKDARATLAKAQEIAAAQPAAKKHEHVKKERLDEAPGARAGAGGQ